MKNRVLSRDIAQHEGKDILLAGWVHRVRELGAISFVLLRDRAGIVQLVFDDASAGAGAVGGGSAQAAEPSAPAGADANAQATRSEVGTQLADTSAKNPANSRASLSPESVIEVRGRVQANAKAVGGFEVQVSEVRVIEGAEPNLIFPVNKEDQHAGIDSLLDTRTISIRNPKILNIFRLQSEIIHHFQRYMRSQDFTEIKTSKLIGSGTEGGTGLFEVQYFDSKVFLAQSPQFYKQIMIASGLERVFEVAPAYRAEKHDTPRHLNEYISIDVEMAFIESVHDLMDLECEMLSAIFAGLQESCPQILEEYKVSLPSQSDVYTIPRIAHDEAREIISRLGGKRVFEINPEGERIICEWAEKEHGISAVFIHSFPRRKRPFYTYPDGQKTQSFDLIFRGLEITTGGRRINNLAMMQEAIVAYGLKEESLRSYTDIFRYGCPPHGGFALGLERLTQKILGLSNVKEASLFPRDRRRVSP